MRYNYNVYMHASLVTTKVLPSDVEIEIPPWMICSITNDAVCMIGSIDLISFSEFTGPSEANKAFIRSYGGKESFLL